MAQDFRRSPANPILQSETYGLSALFSKPSFFKNIIAPKK
jgi:hypothetical protein